MERSADEAERARDAALFRQAVQGAVIAAPGESWYGPLVSRRVSHRIARWIVRRTALSANGVTLLMILAGIAGVLLFLGPPGWAWLAGALFLHGWLVLDAVDGEVARGRGTVSASGVYLDAFGHYVVNPGLLAALALCLPRPPDATWGLALLGFAAAVWSKAAGDVARVVREHASGGGRNARYAGLAGTAGTGGVGGADGTGDMGGADATGGAAARGAGEGDAQGGGSLARLRVLTDAATPVAVLTAVALLSFLPSPSPPQVPVLAGAGAGHHLSPAGIVAAAGYALLTLAHLGKAALIFGRHFRRLSGAGPTGGAAPSGEGGA